MRVHPGERCVGQGQGNHLAALVLHAGRTGGHLRDRRRVHGINPDRQARQGAVMGGHSLLREAGRQLSATQRARDQRDRT